MKIVSLTASLWFVALSAMAEGNLASNATRLPNMAINSVDLTLSITDFTVETGKYYRWSIIHDGREEMQLVAPDLFRNSWINQVVINDLEVQPMGLYAVEFDDEGQIDIWFVPIRPGSFEFWIDGYRERGLKGKFVVR
jgi:hypothetical protein